MKRWVYIRSFPVPYASVLPYFSHPAWEKYGRNMGELRGNERLLGENKLQNVLAHLEGFLADGLAVVVHIGVFPTVAEVTFVGEETYQTALIDKAVGSWREVVVFVNFGQTVGEVVFLVEDGVGERQFDKIEFREDFFHLRDDVVLDAVVVVDM